MPSYVNRVLHSTHRRKRACVIGSGCEPGADGVHLGLADGRPAALWAGGPAGPPDDPAGGSVLWRPKCVGRKDEQVIRADSHAAVAAGALQCVHGQRCLGRALAHLECAERTNAGTQPAQGAGGGVIQDRMTFGRWPRLRSTVEFLGHEPPQQVSYGGVERIIGTGQRRSQPRQPQAGVHADEGAPLRLETGREPPVASSAGLRLGRGQVAQESQFQRGVIR